MATYKKIKYDNKSVQVQSAIEDGKGNKIETTYSTKDTTTDLQEQINNLKQMGRYLSLYDATTGIPATLPPSYPYECKSGDYFIIYKTGTTNYKPTLTTITSSLDFTTDKEITTDEIKVGDYYVYDGQTGWSLLAVAQKAISIDNVVGLQSALNAKQDTIGTISQSNDFEFEDFETITMLNRDGYGVEVTQEGTIIDGVDVDDLASKTNDLAGLKLWSGTQAEYNLITNPDENTIYFIEG